MSIQNRVKSNSSQTKLRNLIVKKLPLLFIQCLTYVAETVITIVTFVIQTMWNSITEKVSSYNNQITDGRVRRGSLLTSDANREHSVSGPLRVYWGIENPIQLKQFDESAIKKTQEQQSWRYTCLPGKQQDLSSSWNSKSIASFGLSNIDENRANSPTNTLRSRTSDDSGVSTSTIDTSGVIMRKNHPIRKSNTVSYRGDTGGRWKRASINGHVYNNDTRVFIPVMGSCTSVMATDRMTTYDVIRALLDKFKVENRPEEFALYIVPDKGSARLLALTDSPLLERLELGPDETHGKLFLKEKVIPDEPRLAWNTLTAKKSDRLSDDSFETPVEKYVEHLPEDIEQLVALPEALLKGVLEKYIKDEDIHVKMVRRKYERIRKLMMALLSRQESFV